MSYKWYLDFCPKHDFTCMSQIILYIVIRTCIKGFLNSFQVSNHMGEVISKTLESCFTDWGIDNILTITLDNVSSNNNVITYFKRRVPDWKFTVLDNKFIHVKYCAHNVNIVVSDKLKEVDESIIKIRNIVKFVRSYYARFMFFKKCMKKLKVKSKIGFFKKIF